MICSKCGGNIDQKTHKCIFCGSSTGLETTNILTENNEQINQKNFIKKYKYILLSGGLILIAIILILIITLINPSNKRAEALINIEKTNYLKFTIGEKDFYLGEKISNYKKKGCSYEDQYINDESYVEGDSIAIYNFYNNEEARFLGAFYCAEKEKCKYEDSVLVKINFYKNSDIIVNDYIKYGMKYEEIVEKYGKEDGTFYQDETLLVWSFGEKGKIGTPYYILRFDNDGWFPTKELIEIRMGIWWYEEEYEYTVVKEKNKEKEVNEK